MLRLHNHKALLSILAAGLAIRIVLFVFLHTDAGFTMDDDSPDYLTLSENIRLGNGFSNDTAVPYAPNTFRTPGYPVFLLIHRMATGTYETALITQSILVVLSAWILARIGFMLGHRRIGLLAAGLFLFMPFSVMVSLRYLTQPLFTFLLMLAAWWWLLFLTTKSQRFLYGTAILLPLIALVRPIAIWLPIPFLLGLLIASRRGFVKSALIVSFIFVAILVPWCFRNYRAVGSYSLSTMRAFQLYYYDLPAVLARARHISYNNAREFLIAAVQPHLASNPDEYASADILNRRSLMYLKHYPFSAAISRIPLLISFFTRDGVHYWFDEFSLKRNTLAMFVERVVLGAFLIGVMVVAVRFPFIALIIAYFAVLSGGVSSAGLRFPVEPLIILLGLIGLHRLYEKIRILSPRLSDRWCG